MRSELLTMCLVWACASLAHAQAPRTGCDPSKVEIDGALQTRWSDAVSSFCAQLASMGDIDAGTHVRISADGDDLTVDASAADGRHALRRVENPEALALTLEALFMLPSAPAQPGATREPQLQEEKAPPIVAAQNTPAPRETDDSTAKSADVEIGVALLGRVAGGPTFLSTGAQIHGGITPGNWVLSLSLRWEPFQELVGTHAPSGFEMDTVAAGFLLARSVLERDSSSVDIGMEASVLTETQSYLVGKMEVTDTDVDLRAGARLRGLFGSGAYRFASFIEAEVSPLRSRQEMHIFTGLPALPAWSIALGFGVVWEDA